MSGGRLWRWVLAGSLGLNLLLGAAVLTREARLLLAPADTTLAELREQPMLALGRVFKALPAEDARVLRHAFLADAPALLAARRRLRAGMDGVRDALGDATLDPALLHARVLAAQQARAALGALAAATLERAAPLLSPAGRRALAELGR